MIQEECQNPRHVNEVCLRATTEPMFFLVQNVVGAASLVLCVTFDFLHFTHNPRKQFTLTSCMQV